MGNAFAGRRILVTGGASGLGRATAQHIIQAGGEVTIADVDPRGRDTAAAIGARFEPLDVTDESAWAALAARLGPLDHAHLNAGMMTVPAHAPLASADLFTVPLERYRRIVAVNLDGVVLGLRALAPLLRTGGSFTVTASIAGLVPLPVDPSYALTKHALIGLVRSMAAAAAARGLRINAICPGAVDTAIVPAEMRGLPLMSPDLLAGDIADLLLHGANGEIRARLSPQAARAMAPPDLGAA